MQQIRPRKICADRLCYPPDGEVFAPSDMALELAARVCSQLPAKALTLESNSVNGHCQREHVNLQAISHRQSWDVALDKRGVNDSESPSQQLSRLTH